MAENNKLELPMMQTQNAQWKKRRGKKAYQKKLEDENNQLQTMIKQLMLDISAKEAENKTLLQQLQFFQKQFGISPASDQSQQNITDKNETDSTNEHENKEKSNSNDSDNFN
ncbi:hypothetical protein M9Y10_044043 [Tritrichomonas musculus]|uniref:BZIP domain-containing protein n=1 Tax=Tritrichomonas musculus TaxID=1915356 RepID=A0ABR2K1D8_9EUKA